MSTSSIISKMMPFKIREWVKAEAEMRYWRRRHVEEGVLGNNHYEYFYTSLFELTRDDYSGLKVLDVGCGPRGSLEWADCAGERVGLDPLVDSYRDLGIDRHEMTYICAPAEAIPFGDSTFDIVASFNSLDHVRDPNIAAMELYRVLAPGGLLLFIVEAEHEATLTEPHRLRADCHEKLFPKAETEWVRRYAMSGNDMYGSIKRNKRFAGESHGIPHILVAKMHKRN
ncbi:class I SAM-dependent methyltransferase [Luteimonas sp. MJ246]|uniref:class I SAM-dependent methyltransferase n=1 Tax=Luteimonas sp. MJ174 TaxID=3129237 RepID=UPI0031BB3B79